MKLVLPFRGSQSATMLAVMTTLMLALPSCGRDQPTAPASHAMTGNVVLRGFLVGEDGRFAGTRVMGDADGVRVELLSSDNVVAEVTTTGGIYRFEGVRPGAYVLRAPVIDGLSYQTDVVTVAGFDLAVADTLRITSRGDIYPVPNPFTVATLGYFELPDTQHVEADIVDLAGKHVRHLLTARLAPGLYQMSWDGLDQDGEVAQDPIVWMTLTESHGSRGQLIFRDPRHSSPAALGPVPRGPRPPGESANVVRVGPVGSFRGRAAQLLR